MPTLPECLSLIESVKKSAADPESAYVIRTRLKRALLGAAHMAAEREGIRVPLMPEDINRLSATSKESAEILRLCVSLLVKTRSLCQPSEALDSRWKSGWEAMRGDLESLERALTSAREPEMGRGWS